MRIIAEKIITAQGIAADLAEKLETMQRAANAAALISATVDAHRNAAELDAMRESVTFNLAMIRRLSEITAEKAAALADISDDIGQRISETL